VAADALGHRSCMQVLAQTCERRTAGESEGINPPKRPSSSRVARASLRQVSAQLGHCAVLELLSAAGADLDAKAPGHGSSALDLARIRCHAPCVALLQQVRVWAHAHKNR
jgi:hypothetical protein